MNGGVPLLLVICAAGGGIYTTNASMLPQESNNSPSFNACEDPSDLVAVMTDALKLMYQTSMFQAVRFPKPLRQSPFRRNEAYLSNLDVLSREISLEDRRCEEKRNITHHTHGLSQTSTCPWEVVESFDPDRIPNSLTEAKCICTECIKDCRRGDLQCRPWFGMCQPVMTSLTVFRRHCNRNSGLYEYRAGLEHVAAGCTCIRPSYERPEDDDDDLSADYDDEEDVGEASFEDDKR